MRVRGRVRVRVTLPLPLPLTSAPSIETAIVSSVWWYSPSSTALSLHSRPSSAAPPTRTCAADLAAQAPTSTDMRKCMPSWPGLGLGLGLGLVLGLGLG